jgi:hypothetical protein
MEGEVMAVVPIAKPQSAPTAQAGGFPWVEIGAPGTLVAGGVLILSGQKKAGTVAAVSGVALALADQQGSIKRLWEALPGYIEHAQTVLSHVQHAVDDVAVRREKLVRIFSR